MQFILHNHPDRIGDTDFIRDRGRQAATVFADCSRQGFSVEDSAREADTVLYHGLHFSPYRLVADVIEARVGAGMDDAERHSLALAVLDGYRSTLATLYGADGPDSFEGSPAWHRARRDISRLVDLHLSRHGL